MIAQSVTKGLSGQTLVLVLVLGGVCAPRAAADWQPVGSAAFSAGEAYCSSLAVNNGDVYVAYRDVANGNKVTVMKYESPAGAPCACGSMGPILWVPPACLTPMMARHRNRHRA